MPSLNSYDACHLHSFTRRAHPHSDRMSPTEVQMRFTRDTVVVITGSSRGLGLEFVKQFIEKTEAAVVATARNPQQSAQLQSLASKNSHRLSLISMDASDESSIEAAVKAVSLAHSGIDLLINNAGIAEAPTSILEMTAATYRDILNVNVVGTFLITKAFLPLLKNKQSRTVINISSTQGSINWSRVGFNEPEKNFVGSLWVAYNSSKAALNMQTSTFANELKKESFCIIALSPGWVDTDMGGGNARKLGLARAPLDAEESISKMLKVIQQLKLNDSGKFLDQDFKEVDY